MNDKNSLFGFGYQDPENYGGERVPAPIGTPKQLAGRADSPGKPISAQIVFDKGRYVNLRGEEAPERVQTLMTDRSIYQKLHRLVQKHIA